MTLFPCVVLHWIVTALRLIQLNFLCFARDCIHLVSYSIGLSVFHVVLYWSCYETIVLPLEKACASQRVDITNTIQNTTVPQTLLILRLCT